MYTIQCFLIFPFKFIRSWYLDLSSEWRHEEMAVINETLTGAERKAALCQLLEQETQLLASIGRHKIGADTENKEKTIQSFLNKVHPTLWLYIFITVKALIVGTLFKVAAP